MDEPNDKPPLHDLDTLLGPGSRFEGKLWLERASRLEGAFRGVIRGGAGSVLVIGPGAEVDADVFVDAIVVRGGVVRGELRARQSVELYVPGEVAGNLAAPSIHLAKGARFSGACVMGPVSDPDVGEAS